jgi:tetratricopeptide (TPR) repeat protein
MVHRWKGIVLGSLLLAASSSAAAAAADALLELWRTGKYEQAIEAGEAADTAQSLSLAARAAVSDMMMRIPPCLECVHRAQALARKAIAADPKAALPLTYLAVSLGYEARIVGLLESQRKGLAGESRSAIDAAIAADSKNSFAVATLGGWNIDTVRIGGSLLARLTYGATIDDGMKKYAEAVAMEPDNFVIRYQYALSLASYDADKYHDVIKEQLARATQGKPGSVYESLSQRRAVELLGLLRAGGKKLFAHQVKRDMGIPE